MPSLLKVVQLIVATCLFATVCSVPVCEAGWRDRTDRDYSSYRSQRNHRSNEVDELLRKSEKVDRWVKVGLYVAGAIGAGLVLAAIVKPARAAELIDQIQLADDVSFIETEGNDLSNSNDLLVYRDANGAIFISRQRIPRSQTSPRLCQSLFESAI